MASWFAAFRPPPPPRTPFERAVAMIERGRHADALEELDRALEAATDDRERARARNKRGVAHVALGRSEQALEEFCAALCLDEKSAPAMVNIGNLLLEDGHLDDAIDHYRAALRIDETYATAHRNLGVACKRAGRRAEAVRHLRAATRYELSPKKPR